MHYLALLFTGVPSSSYNLLSHLRVGVALRASIETLYEGLNRELKNHDEVHDDDVC